MMFYQRLAIFVGLFWASSGQGLIAADLPDYCLLDGASRVRDKLEAYVFSGVGQAPACVNGDCCLSTPYREMVITKRFEPNSLWSRIVKYDSLKEGYSGKTFSVTLVETDGRDIGIGSGEFSVENSNILSDERGFGFLPVVVRFGALAPTAKVYLTKFIYADLSSLSYSYGPYFYITESDSVSSDLRDELMLKGFNIVGPVR